ncbi:MAG: hypothetical protein KF832_13190 [Caldilineaceae bacterium]|nr:hypothetical protein [Caldilineaceae bacterium]
MFANLRAWYQRHTAFLTIFLLFVAFRFLAILLFRPGGFIADNSDYEFYYEWGLQLPRGYRTFVDLWTAYPPLFPALMLPIFEWSSRIPPWLDPRLFFHLFFGLELLLFESANFILIARLARKLGYPPLGTTTGDQEGVTAQAALHPAVLYALLFLPAYTMLGWFEAMPLSFMLLGLDLLLSQHRWGWLGSAVAAALGFLTKLTPALLVPIAIRWLGSQLSWQALRQAWFRWRSPGNLLRPALYTLLFFGVVAGLGYSLAEGNVTLALSSFRVNSIRPPWQSLWALLDGYYDYGLVPVNMRNLAGLQTNHWESRLPWGAITLAFSLLYLWLYTRRYDWAQPRTPITFAAISVIWLFLYSKGWSPQFLVWIAAFVVLLLPTLRGMLIVTVLTLLNIIESPIFFVMLRQEEWILVGTVVLRTLLLLILAVELLGQIWPQAARGRLLQQGAAWASGLVMMFTAIGLVAGAPRAAQAYADRRLAEHPCREAIVYLQQQAEWPNPTIVSDQIEIWRDFSPWLADQYTIRIVDGYDPVNSAWDQVLANRLATYVQDREFWWVTYPDQPSQAAAYFARPTVKAISTAQWGACRVARVQQPPAQPVAEVTVAGGPILLRATAVGAIKVGEALRVVLYWESASPVAESYTVFTHLLNADGQLVAQKDNLPVEGLAPTNTWTAGTLIRDPYQFDLPPTLPVGEYQLWIGLYTAAGRQPVTQADGTVADHVAIPVRITE